MSLTLYIGLIALRPDWAIAKHDDAEAENSKTSVVITNSS